MDIEEIAKILTSPYPPSLNPTAWGNFLGHEVESNWENGYPGVGLERYVYCSCGLSFLGRSTAPDWALYDAWNRFREHIVEDLRQKHGR